MIGHRHGGSRAVVPVPDATSEDQLEGRAGDFIFNKFSIQLSDASVSLS